eukprot:15361897-Ditylum_brightwellii.AAC.1
MELILNHLLATAPSCSILVYASPQSLTTKENGPFAFLDFLLQHCHLLAMIVIDEIHLLTDFGRSFRSEEGKSQPTSSPTHQPTLSPSITGSPTKAPTKPPTASPTKAPVSSSPTKSPITTDDPYAVRDCTGVCPG